MSTRNAAGRVRTFFIRPKARSDAVTVAEGRLLADRVVDVEVARRQYWSRSRAARRQLAAAR